MEITEAMVIIAIAIIAPYIVADFVVSKYGSKIRKKSLLMAIVAAVGFFFFPYIIIMGYYNVCWTSYIVIAVTPLFLFALGRTYPRTLKEATIIIGKKIRQVVSR